MCIIVHPYVTGFEKKGYMYFYALPKINILRNCSYMRETGMSVAILATMPTYMYNKEHGDCNNIMSIIKNHHFKQPVGELPFKSGTLSDLHTLFLRSRKRDVWR